MSARRQQAEGQNKEKVRNRQKAQAKGPGPTAQTESFDSIALQQAAFDPATASPADILALQRGFGNEAVSSLIQAKLTVGLVGDKYEKEADRVAQHVIADQQTIQRREEEEELQIKPAASKASAEAGPELESSLASKRSTGKPLPTGVRSDMESRFGADLGQVRIHTDGSAVQMSREINAQAFTHGSDIYMDAGKYNPGTMSGKRLLAHELTHTIQQTGGIGTQYKATNRGKVKPSHPISRAPASSVQRLVSRVGFIRLAGDVSDKAKKRKSTYWKILNKLDDYHVNEWKKNAKKIKAKEYGQEKRKRLNELITLIGSWLESHTRVKEAKTPEEQETRVAKETKDVRKAMFLDSLKKEAQIEIAKMDGKTSEDLPDELKKAEAYTPSMGIEYYEQAEKQASTLWEETEQGIDNAAKYKVSVLAAVEHPDYFEFARKRLALRIENEQKRFKQLGVSRGVKTGQGIKEEAVRAVAKEKYGSLDDKKRLAKIQELLGLGAQVGHTWVKVGAYSASNELVQEHSFGFYPLAFAPHPEAAVPGKVKYPDTGHDHDDNMQRRDHPVKVEQFNKAMEKATKTMQSPPSYTMSGFNCTQFAKEVADAAGVSFPKSAYMRVPTTWGTKLMGQAGREIADPNALYREMEKDPQAYNPTAIAKQKDAEEKERREWLSKVDLELFDHLSVKMRNPVKTITGADVVDELGEKGTLDDILSVYEENVGFLINTIFYDGELYRVHLGDYESFVKAVSQALDEAKSSEQPSQVQVEEEPQAQSENVKEEEQSGDAYKVTTYKLLVQKALNSGKYAEISKDEQIIVTSYEPQMDAEEDAWLPIIWHGEKYWLNQRDMEYDIRRIQD